MFKSDNKNYGSLVKETRIGVAGRRKKEGRKVGLKEARKMKREGGKGKERKKKLFAQKSEKGGKRKLEFIL